MCQFRALEDLLFVQRRPSSAAEFCMSRLYVGPGEMTHHAGQVAARRLPARMIQAGLGVVLPAGGAFFGESIRVFNEVVE